MTKVGGPGEKLSHPIYHRKIVTVYQLICIFGWGCAFPNRSSNCILKFACLHNDFTFVAKYVPWRTVGVQLFWLGNFRMLHFVFAVPTSGPPDKVEMVVWWTESAKLGLGLFCFARFNCNSYVLRETAECIDNYSAILWKVNWCYFECWHWCETNRS